jgi:hypothetical protein
VLYEQVFFSQVDAFPGSRDIYTWFYNIAVCLPVEPVSDPACIYPYFRCLVRNTSLLGNSRAVFILADSLLDAYKNITPKATLS